MIGALTLVPESPRYLCEVNKVEDAKRSIAKSNKVSPEDPAVQAELDLIMAGIEAEKLAGNASWGNYFPPRPKYFNVC